MSEENMKILGDKVERYLKEMELVYEVAKDSYRVRYESTMVFITPDAWDNGETFLRMAAVVLYNVKLQGNETMFREFNDWNDGKLFASIYWTEYADNPGVGNILLRDNLFGDTMDLPEFNLALRVLMLSADELDDKLKDKYGGERFID